MSYEHFAQSSRLNAKMEIVDKDLLSVDFKGNSIS